MKGIAKAEKTASTNTLVIVKNDIPVISHITIAENTNNDKSSIKRLIENNSEDLKEFGSLGFEIQTRKREVGATQIKEYFLNEQQATLLMTYLRNNAVVKEFKKNLVRVFYTLKENQLESFTPIVTNTRLMQDGFALPNIPLNYDDIGQFGLAVWQGLARVQEMMTEQNEQLILAKNLLAEQHEIINTLTEESEKLAEENYELKSNPLAMLTKSLQIATGREVQLSLGPTMGNNLDNTHTTIKGFCAEHKIKLNQGDSIRFANIIKKLCKQAGEIIEKIPDARYGTLNIYPRYLLADAVKFL